MIASLGMYDWPEVRRHTDELWAGLAAALRAEGITDVPARLERKTPLRLQWSSPDLLFSQTCGYPLTHAFDGMLTVLATPAYGVDGCAGSDYASAIIVQADSPYQVPADLRDASACFNYSESMSGHLALRAVFAPLARDGRFFTGVSRSGSHPVSMQWVADGKVDTAAIDCVSYAVCRRYRPEIARRLRVIAFSPGVPGLPYVTAVCQPSDVVARLRSGLQSVIADPRLAGVRESLFIKGLEFTDRATYDRITALESKAFESPFNDLD